MGHSDGDAAALKRGMTHQRSIALLACLAVVLALLAVLQVASWSLYGRATLLRNLPGMARSDLVLRQGDDGGGLPAFEDFVLTQEDHDQLEPDVARRLRATFREFGLRLHSEKDLPPPCAVNRSNGMGLECSECYLFLFEVTDNTPLLSRVRTDHFRNGLAFVSYSHWRLWLLGVWIPISDRFAGIG